MFEHDPAAQRAKPFIAPVAIVTTRVLDGEPLPERKSNRTMHYQRATSSAALDRLRSGYLNRQQKKVLRLWVHLGEIGMLPCSTKTAAEYVTRGWGENGYGSTSNYDVIHKRTPELVTAGKLVEIPAQVDLDEKKRNFYAIRV